MTVAPAVFDRDVLPLDKAGFAEPLTKCRDEVLIWGGVANVPNHGHSPLLCARGNRPRRRAAKSPDELPAPHSITSSARASSVGGISRPNGHVVPGVGR